MLGVATSMSVSDAPRRSPCETASKLAAAKLDEHFGGHLDERAFRQSSDVADAPAKIAIRNLDFWYGDAHALRSVNFDIREGAVTAFIGPSGCGKSTLLKCLNRMQDEVPGHRIEGSITMSGPDETVEVYDEDIDPPLFRRRFGWVAQKPNPFPSSVYNNIAYPARLHGLVRSGAEMDAHVEEMLRAAGLWDELRDRLKEPGTDLSGGQQQRLCIARALSPRPEVMLMDEPCGSLDPISTERVEELIDSLRGRVTIVIITHNMEQAARVSDFVAFFKLGEMLEFGPARDVLLTPRHAEAKAYLAGRFG